MFENPTNVVLALLSLVVLILVILFAIEYFSGLQAHNRRVAIVQEDKTLPKFNEIFEVLSGKLLNSMLVGNRLFPYEKGAINDLISEIKSGNFEDYDLNGVVQYLNASQTSISPSAVAPLIIGGLGGVRFLSVGDAVDRTKRYVNGSGQLEIALGKEVAGKLLAMLNQIEMDGHATLEQAGEILNLIK